MKQKQITKICQICNKNYSLPLWLSKIKNTCSKKCGYNLYSINSNKNKSRNCIVCHNYFIKKSSSKGLFCSRQCYWNSKKRKTDYKCLDCGIKVSCVKTVKRCHKCEGIYRTGENHPRWIDDRTKLSNRQERGDSAYREWRLCVWKRDKFKCRISNTNCDGRIEAHHILGWKSHPELRYIINNGITLCHAHHPRTRSGEFELSPYFQKLVAEMQ